MTLPCPAPPDWLTTAMSPAGRRAPWIVAVDVSAKPSTKLIMPLQFGPISLTPPSRASRTIRCCMARTASVPSSPKHDENTVAYGTPRAAQSSRSEAHTSELQSLMRSSDAVVCLKKTTTREAYQERRIQDPTHERENQI